MRYLIYFFALFLATKTKETAKIIPIILFLSASYEMYKSENMKRMIPVLIVSWLVIVSMFPLNSIQTDAKSKLRYRVSNVADSAKEISSYLYPNLVAWFRNASEWIDS